MTNSPCNNIGGRNEDRLLCSRRWMAAFANGALSHALDYSSIDDHSVATGGVTVPYSLAMAERISNTNGKQLFTAIALGNEVLMRIGCAITTGHPVTDFGWVSPMLLGVFGSAVAAGKIAQLESKQMADAIGIALHQAAGTWEMAEEPTSTFRHYLRREATQYSFRINRWYGGKSQQNSINHTGWIR